jgi:hypothetical protein
MLSTEATAYENKVETLFQVETDTYEEGSK